MSNRIALSVLLGALIGLGAASAQAFNPQPDPPGRNITKPTVASPATSTQGTKNQASCKTDTHAAAGGNKQADAKCLNPQPLPPG